MPKIFSADSVSDVIKIFMPQCEECDGLKFMVVNAQFHINPPKSYKDLPMLITARPLSPVDSPMVYLHAFEQKEGIAPWGYMLIDPISLKVPKYYLEKKIFHLINTSLRKEEKNDISIA